MGKSNQEKLNQLEEMLAESEEGLKGVSDLRFVVSNIEALGLQTANLDLDVTLARGLNYYTGAIYEVSAPEGVKMGSIGGGGRYDDLTGIFGPELSRGFSPFLIRKKPAACSKAFAPNRGIFSNSFLFLRVPFSFL